MLEMNENALVATQETVIDTEAAEDIAEARATYKDILKQGKEGLDVALKLVEGSEHPRAIEVFSGLINNLANVNSKLIDLHKAKQELREAAPSAQPGTTNNIQNNVYVGSPKDLLELMNGDGPE
jgi:methionyl-tRNA formyltransferase